MNIFLSAKDSTIFDLVINTYGDLNFIGQFIKDNNVNNINKLTNGGEIYTYNFQVIEDYEIINDFINKNYKIVTGQKPIFYSNPEENYLLTELPEILDDDNENHFLVE